MTSDVFLLVFDTLRRDYIEPYSKNVSTPGFSKLFADSIVLEKAYSTGSWTVPAHGSLFTGKYPSEHGATGLTKKLPREPKTIAEVTSDNGYEPVAISTNPWVSPDFGFYRGFGSQSEFIYPELPFADVGSPWDAVNENDDLLRSFSKVLRWSTEKNTTKRLIKAMYAYLFFDQKVPSANEVTDQLTSSLDSVSDSMPVFGFVNYMDAHEPYFDDERDSQIKWNLHSVGSSPEIGQNTIRDGYKSSVESLDNGVSYLVEQLRDQDRYDDALIIGVADHGQSLGEHDYWGHGTYLYDELLHVPAFVKPPGGSQSDEWINQPFSIRRVFDLVSQATDGEIDDLRLWLQNATERVVAAESTGPHMDIEHTLDAVSEAGYWKFYGGSWKASKYLDDGELTIHQNQEDIPKEEIYEDVNKYVDDNDISTTKMSDNNSGLSSDIEKRLEHLGYK
ncbi:sulfatase [Haloferax massiliensis]|uniref:Sulfatase n=1 Tax=Haloferax massiliensis TaxID=1476858 RepID=A0A0D6JM97_9EURY|nr:sulfatase [Haloferax massiliensis]CQR48723.1 Sulfatase [Haloferax massiliensis]